MLKKLLIFRLSRVLCLLSFRLRSITRKLILPSILRRVYLFLPHSVSLLLHFQRLRLAIFPIFIIFMPDAILFLKEVAMFVSDRSSTLNLRFCCAGGALIWAWRSPPTVSASGIWSGVFEFVLKSCLPVLLLRDTRYTRLRRPRILRC